MSIQVGLDRERIAEFCRKWKVLELSLFGSVLREDFRPDSDIDVLVSLAPDAKWSILDLVAMQFELEEICGRSVDLVTRRGIERSQNFLRRREILSTAESFYVAG